MARKGTFKDLTGRVFGKLTVMSLHHAEERQWVRQKATVRFYLCKCECGKEKVIAGPSLTKDQRVRSCGCIAKVYRKTLAWRSHLFKEGTPFRIILKQYKRGARERGLSWELTDTQFRQITAQPCYYTGALPGRTKTAKSGEVFTYNGIDRLDSNIGYTVENCVPCCTEVNMMKQDLDKELFLELCCKIAERCKENVITNNQSRIEWVGRIIPKP